ncbi:MAG: hypothetical protein AABX51_08765 [Nanoarchaeota archaeon]
MAASPKAPQKGRIDVNIDKAIYDLFIRNCASKGYAPSTIIERLVKKFNETGQF